MIRFRYRRDTTLTLLSAHRKKVFVLVLLCFLFAGLSEDEFSLDDNFRNSFRPQLLLDGSISERINPSNRDPQKPLVYLATVICSKRLEEGVTMIKTAILFSKEANLYLIVFTDSQNQLDLTSRLEELAKAAEQLNISLEYELRPVYIDPSLGRSWHLMFAPCSTQRLFFPQTLPHIGELMYMDSDVLFLSSITDLWNELSHMKPHQMAAVAPEHELPGDGWYNRRSRIPYYGPRGLNTGTMIMNLTAMREFDFSKQIFNIAENYAQTIKWADQDMMNILFHYFPMTLHEIGCEFNYRVQHCLCDFPETGDCGCKAAEKDGVSIFHGNRHMFYRERFIKNIHKAFKQMSLTESPHKLLEDMMREYRSLGPEKPCTGFENALFLKFQKYVQKHWKL